MKLKFANSEFAALMELCVINFFIHHIFLNCFACILKEFLLFYLQLKNCINIVVVYSGSTTSHGDSFRRLFFSCEHLEKVFLVSFREITECDLRALTQCKNLKQLDLLGTLSLTPEICYTFFVNCPKLEMIDLSFCDNITDCSIQWLQQKYPHVAIKRLNC